MLIFKKIGPARGLNIQRNNEVRIDMADHCLVADIGGTNARFGVYRRGQLTECRHYKCSDYTQIEDVISQYLASIDSDSDINQAVLAVATHPNSDMVTFTNQSWSFKPAELAQTFRFERLRVINDLTAMALAVPLIEQQQTQKISGGHGAVGAVKAVVGAGTGLGVSGLVPINEQWIPLQGEGGHVMYGAANDFEKKVLSHVNNEHDYISAEELLCGRGLVTIYKAITLLNGRTNQGLEPAEIVSQGLAETNITCVETLKTYFAILGSVCRDIVLTLGARGGVYLTGGVLNHMPAYFSQSKEFKERFYHSGRMNAYMSDIPVFLLLNTQAALIGAYQSILPDQQSFGVNIAR